jgi:hypothetical protein
VVAIHHFPQSHQLAAVLVVMALTAGQFLMVQRVVLAAVAILVRLEDHLAVEQQIKVTRAVQVPFLVTLAQAVAVAPMALVATVRDRQAATAVRVLQHQFLVLQSLMLAAVAVPDIQILQGQAAQAVAATVRQLVQAQREQPIAAQAVAVQVILQITAATGVLE